MRRRRRPWPHAARRPGDGRDELELITGGARSKEPGAREWDRLFERLAGVTGLTRRRATFTRDDVLQAVCEQLPPGARVDRATLEAVADRFLSSFCCPTAQALADQATVVGVVSAGWEDRAPQWLAWARTPGHDAYWRYRAAFFAIVPPPVGRTLEVGCGEGRVTRDLAARGHAVTAVDASPTLLAAAAGGDPSGTYLVADACELPFEDASFDLVVAYNMLMDVQDMPRAVGEAARVLTATGRFCACVTHPATDAGAWRAARDAGDHDYLGGGTFELDDERDGLRMRWDGNRHSFEHYSQALERAGLLLEAIREPPPDPPDGGYAPWTHVPMFLMFRARRAD